MNGVHCTEHITEYAMQLGMLVHGTNEVNHDQHFITNSQFLILEKKEVCFSLNFLYYFIF